MPLIFSLLFSFTELCSFGNVYIMNSSTGSRLDHLTIMYTCKSLIRLHGATTVNITFTFFDIEGNKDIVWLYPGFVTNTSTDAFSTYPPYDDMNPPENLITYYDSNFWVAIYTDKNIVSSGFAFNISAGEFGWVYHSHGMVRS